MLYSKFKNKAINRVFYSNWLLFGKEALERRNWKVKIFSAPNDKNGKLKFSI